MNSVDVNAINSRVGLVPFNSAASIGIVSDWDINGDGWINVTDRALAQRAIGRKIKWDLWLDD